MMEITDVGGDGEGVSNLSQYHVHKYADLHKREKCYMTRRIIAGSYMFLILFLKITFY